MTIGRITIQGRIEHHFGAFGLISVLFIQMEFRKTDERLDAVAQVIAECDGRPFISYIRCVFYSFESNAANGFHVPIIGILCNGMSFEFFSFDMSNSHKFSRGL